MERSMSRMVNGQLVEFAGASSNVPFPLSDDEARERCRSAPLHIRRSIDAFREARGMRRLWTPDGKHPASATPAQVTTEPVIPDRVMLVGVVAPGLSAMRVRVATDGELLRERITPAAFEGAVRMVKTGTSVVRLTDGHGGDTLADTKTGTLQLAVDGAAGLIIQAVVPVMSLHRQLLADAFEGRCGLSIGLRPARMELKRENGERVRVVKELAALDHVAVIRSYAGQGEPCYRTKVFAALTNDQGAMKMARAKAVVSALEDILEQKRKG